METKELVNPLAFTSITGLLQALLNMVIVISIPIVVFFIIYSGFLYVTAQGTPEKLQNANRSLMYAIIGGVVIVGSVVILEIVQNTVNAF
jgi:hypothetical protein